MFPVKYEDETLACPNRANVMYTREAPVLIVNVEIDVDFLCISKETDLQISLAHYERKSKCSSQMFLPTTTLFLQQKRKTYPNKQKLFQTNKE